MFCLATDPGQWDAATPKLEAQINLSFYDIVISGICDTTKSGVTVRQMEDARTTYNLGSPQGHVMNTATLQLCGGGQPPRGSNVQSR